jgi:hypothetical protein
MGDVSESQSGADEHLLFLYILRAARANRYFLKIGSLTRSLRYVPVAGAPSHRYHARTFEQKAHFAFGAVWSRCP